MNTQENGSNHEKDDDKDMSGSVFYTRRELEAKYTEDGIARLSLAILATLHHKELSERDLSEISQVPRQTLNKYVKAEIRHPQSKVLKKLSPHLLRVKAISPVDIEVDLARTYDDDWRSLNLLATEFYNLDLPQTKPETDQDLN